jgi:hypothetical protein
VQLLLSGGMTYSTDAHATIGTDRSENTNFLLLFTCRCLVTAGCCGSTILALSEYATVLIFTFIYILFISSLTLLEGPKTFSAKISPMLTRNKNVYNKKKVRTIYMLPFVGYFHKVDFRKCQVSQQY